MRTLNEQWIKNDRMYKAVAGIPNFCIGCCWSDAYHCCGVEDCPTNHIKTGLIVHDLGPVNDIGLPLCPFCKGYPELESEENWEGRDIWFVECAKCGARTAEYLEAEEAVDAWIRRAEHEY